MARRADWGRAQRCLELAVEVQFSLPTPLLASCLGWSYDGNMSFMAAHAANVSAWRSGTPAGRLSGACVTCHGAHGPLDALHRRTFGWARVTSATAMLGDPGTTRPGSQAASWQASLTVAQNGYA